MIFVKIYRLFNVPECHQLSFIFILDLRSRKLIVPTTGTWCDISHLVHLIELHVTYQETVHLFASLELLTLRFHRYIHNSECFDPIDIYLWTFVSGYFAIIAYLRVPQ